MKAKYTEDTEFPRFWKENGFSIVTQPYITGLYVAATPPGGGIPQQMGVNYTKLKSFLKKLRENPKVEDLQVRKLGEFLKKSDIELLNR